MIYLIGMMRLNYCLIREGAGREWSVNDGDSKMRLLGFGVR
jgi:hypothetical protein